MFPRSLSYVDKFYLKQDRLEKVIFKLILAICFSLLQQDIVMVYLGAMFHCHARMLETRSDAFYIIMYLHQYILLIRT